jgi:two-component system, OmpR family, response regulator
MNEAPPTTPSSIAVAAQPVRVLLLDDEPSNLLLRAMILRQHGYECVTAGSVDQAIASFGAIDIAVLDYHLGKGQFGTDVAVRLREVRPEVPIIILSATLEHRFGGVEDMHLLKGYSSNDDLIASLRSFEAKRRGAPVVVDAREFFYSRIGLAIGPDVLVQIFDALGNWVYCNEAAADYLGQNRDWFPGRNLFVEMPTVMRNWREMIFTVASTRETYIDRSRRGLLNFSKGDEPWDAWSVLGFPITLHDGRNGVVLTARVLGKTNSSFA